MAERAGKPMTLFADYAFAWAMTGMIVVRARSQTDAQAKFAAMSRASMLNKSDIAFHSAAVAMQSEGADAITSFAEAILHGDETHRQWLRDAAAAWNAGRPLPPPRSATHKSVATATADPEPGR